MLTFLTLIVAGMSLVLVLTLLIIGTMWNKIIALEKRLVVADSDIKLLLREHGEMVAGFSRRLNELQKLVDKAVLAVRQRPHLFDISELPKKKKGVN